MKIDLDYFDSKGRYWVFYLSIGWTHFMIAICIADYELELSTMHYTPLEKYQRGS